MPGGVSTAHKRLQRLFAVHANYTATTLKLFTGLYKGVSVYLPYFNTQYISHTSRLYTTRATPEGIPSNATPAPIPDTTATPDAAQVSAAAYYNNVYRSAPVRPVIDPRPAVQHSTDYSTGGGSVRPACIQCMSQPGGWRSGTGSAARAHTPPGGAVQRQGRGGWRGTIDGYRRISFRAFAR